MLQNNAGELKRENGPPERPDDLDRPVLWLIILRAPVLLLSLNLASPLGLLPENAGPYPFLPLYNVIAVTLTLLFLSLRWKGVGPILQLRVQAGFDLVFSSLVIARTGGVESVFVFFYLLTIVYCALLMGRNGGMIAASLSSIFYAAIVGYHLTLDMRADSQQADLPYLSFRIALHAAGFFAVACLGAFLSRRLSTVQAQLAEKTDSLRHLERLNDRIVNSIRNGLMTVGLDGTISTFNSAAEEISGMRSRDVAGRHVASVVGDELWSRIRSVDLLRQARPLRAESGYEVPGGGRRHLGFGISPLLDDGHQLMGYIVSFQDLTDIKRLEEEVRVRDRMAAIGRMAAGIAHEIRNPLAAMQGSVELLRQRALLQPSEQRLLEILQRESARLNRFVEEFLRFAQPGDYPREALNLVPILQDFATILRNDPEVKRRYEVTFLAENDHVPVVGHANQLQQVFWNLSQNAFRAMPSGGTLDILARRAADGGGEVEMIDDGIGMTEEEKKNLFQPFRAGFRSGTGLGLSIVFHIMEDHRGRIEFESRECRGTRVRLCFPPLAAAPAAINRG